MDIQSHLGSSNLSGPSVSNQYNSYSNRTQAFLYDDMHKLNEVFTQEEIELMFYTLYKSNDYLKSIWGSWMKSRDLCILSALRYMLLRPKEACSLRFEDFIWEKSLLKIRGENNKQRKDRFVFVHPTFLKYYKEYLTFPKWMWKGSLYLFPSSENERLSSGRWKCIFRQKILKPAGIYYEGRRSYLLRATGATELLDEGADPWTVAQSLGHGDLRTVKNYYFQTNRFREKQAYWMGKLK